jgi:hypothetical protein
VKYIQQVGRGLRKNGDKRCVILDNVGMYARFGLPDEDRDWGSFFYGNEKEYASEHTRSYNRSCLREYSEVDLSEGDEAMVLIQDLETPQVVEELTLQIMPLDNTSNLDNGTQERHFAIRSKSFNSGKYIIEENETGFYIVNNRTSNRMLLTKMQTLRGGTIIINRETDKKTFTIIKTLSTQTLHTGLSRIVGTIRKEGLLLKFTAFDKTKINITITV